MRQDFKVFSKKFMCLVCHLINSLYIYVSQYSGLDKEERINGGQDSFTSLDGII